MSIGTFVTRLAMMPVYEPAGRLPPIDSKYDIPIKKLDWMGIHKWRADRRAIGKPSRMVDYFEFHKICCACMGCGSTSDDGVCPICEGLVHPLRILTPDDVFVVRTSVANRYYCCEPCLYEDPHSDSYERLNPGEYAKRCNTCEGIIDLRKSIGWPEG